MVKPQTEPPPPPSPDDTLLSTTTKHRNHQPNNNNNNNNNNRITDGRNNRYHNTYDTRNGNHYRNSYDVDEIEGNSLDRFEDWSTSRYNNNQKMTSGTRRPAKPTRKTNIYWPTDVSCGVSVHGNNLLSMVVFNRFSASLKFFGDFCAYVSMLKNVRNAAFSCSEIAKYSVTAMIFLLICTLKTNLNVKKFLSMTSGVRNRCLVMAVAITCCGVYVLLENLNNIPIRNP